MSNAKILLKGGVVMLAFEISEYQYRINKTKEKMAEQGLDVLVITDPGNMNYLTGYDGWAFYVHQCLVIILHEEQPIWIGRGMDANAAKITTWLDSSHIIPYPDDYVQSFTKHPMQFVAEIMKEDCLQKATIGLEMDNYYFTAKCYESLIKELPNATFKDATNLVNKVRLIKSDKEIEYMKIAGKIANRTMQVGIDAIAEGVRECDVVADIYHAQISGTSEYGGDYPAIVPLMPAGEKTSTPHLTWSDNELVYGEPVILEIAGCYKRYHCPLARTVMIGPPPQHIIDLSEVVIEGLNAVLDYIRPGITCEEVEKVWSKSIEKSGFIKESRLGYPVGVNYPPDWGEHTASMRKGDRTVLEPNMTFHLIPGIWLDNFGVELSETIRVTKDGCETLAGFSRQLFIKE